MGPSAPGGIEHQIVQDEDRNGSGGAFFAFRAMFSAGGGFTFAVACGIGDRFEGVDLPHFLGHHGAHDGGAGTAAKREANGDHADQHGKLGFGGRGWGVLRCCGCWCAGHGRDGRG